MRSQLKKSLTLFCVLVFLSGCSTAMKDIQKSNHWIREKNYDKAIDELKPLAEKDSDDQLLYLLNLGLAYHFAGRFDDSIQTFLKADAIAEIKDYTSLSREAGSILLNDAVLQYRGDDYEKILIHIYLSLNFLMKNDLDGALVESRRVNEILQKFRDEAKRNYQQNAFAFYLSGVVWEADKKWDDAYISYNDTYKYVKNNDYLKEDLIRSSKKASRDEDYEKWKKLFKNQTNAAVDKNTGELIFIFQQGQGPVKRPNPSFTKIPKLFPTASVSARASLEVAGKNVKTETIYNLEDVAIKSLEEQYALLIGKRVGGLAAKYILAKQVGKKNELLGVATWIGLNLADQADLRQWSNLPETFQIARIKLPAGVYKINVAALDYANKPTTEKQTFEKIEIKAGKMTFLNWRAFD